MSYSSRRRLQRSTIGLPINEFLDSLETKCGAEMTLDDVFEDDLEYKSNFEISNKINPTPIRHATQDRNCRENLYDILGLTPGCTTKDLKVAYRKLVIKLHPDKGGDNHLFDRLQLAYKILSEEESRFLYNEFGDGAIDIIQSLNQRLF